jgi:4-diphosphocytidyl-2-C-methyl-D-erythritol kinase
MIYFSPAKINLGLRIPYKRVEDGLHQIESIFLRLDWGDSLQIKENAFSATPGFTMETEILLSPSKKIALEKVTEKGDITKNLLYKTWQKALEINPDIPPFHIHLVKKIPPGGGLGGGSSNSASLWRYFIDKNYLNQEQAKLACAKLGADIPFFLLGTHAWTTGFGEILEPISVETGWGVLAIPTISLPTASMYANLKKPLQKSQPSKTWREQEGEVLLAVEKGNWKVLQAYLVNDFEKVAYELHPSLELIRDAFWEVGGEYSSMTGSGSSIFALTSSREQQESIKKQMQDRFPELELHTFSF